MSRSRGEGEGKMAILFRRTKGGARELQQGNLQQRPREEHLVEYAGS